MTIWESWGVLRAALTPDASFWLPWTALVLSWVTSEYYWSYLGAALLIPKGRHFSIITATAN